MSLRAILEVRLLGQFGLGTKGSDVMETKDAGTGAAIVVLLAILGLMIMIGLILLMMWKQPGIEHSPSQQSSLCAPSTTSELTLEFPYSFDSAQLTQSHKAFRGAM
jgi:hypothetical protein